MRVRLIGALAAAAVLAAAACADFESPEDRTFGLPDVEVAQPSFARDVQPILTRRCVVGGCHTLAAHQAGMALDSTVSYDMLVNVPANTGLFPRVNPGNAADSWLVRRIQADPGPRGGAVRMPLAATPLTDNQIATIVNWINQGALDN